MTEPPPSDSYSDAERKSIGPYRRGLLRVTAPLVWTLVRLGVHPNAISASQVAGGFLVLALVPEHPRWAWLLFLFILLTDAIDGAVARAGGKASRFGALVDQYATTCARSLSSAGWRCLARSRSCLVFTGDAANQRSVRNHSLDRPTPARFDCRHEPSLGGCRGSPDQAWRAFQRSREQMEAA